MHDQQSIEIPTLIEDKELLPFYMTTGAAGAEAGRVARKAVACARPIRAYTLAE